MAGINTQKIQVTDEKVLRMINHILTVPTETVGGHLTDEQSIDYLLGELEEDEINLIDKHILTCEDCGLKLEQLSNKMETWGDPISDNRLVEMQFRIRSSYLINVLTVQLKALFGVSKLSHYTLSAALNKVKSKEINGIWNLVLRRDRTGNYALIISCYELVLEGIKIRIDSKDWFEEVTLRKVSDNEVGAKLIVPENIFEKLSSEKGSQITVVIMAPQNTL